MRIGVIGAGYWGPNIIRNFVELPATQVKAVADLDAGRLASVGSRFPQIPHLTQDYRSLFEMDLDGVAVCTPPETHHVIVAECLRNGLNVLVEKPLTTDVTTSEELARLAEEHERVLMVGHTFVYNPAVRALKAMLDGGDLGDILYVDAVRVGLGMFHPSLNVIWDLAPHDVSILMYLFGEVPETVAAHGISCVQDGVEDVAYLTLMFPSGVMAHSRLSWLDPMKTRRVTLVGARRMAVYDDVALDEKVRVFDKRVDAFPSPGSFGDFQFSYHHGGITSPPVRFEEPLRLEVAHFAECITTGIRPQSDAAEGVQVVRVIEAAQISLRSGGAPVRVKDGAIQQSVELASQLVRVPGLGQVSA